MEAVSDRREFPILKYRQGQTSEVSDVVVAEYNLAIQVNGRDFVILLCTPRSLDVLVAGFLFSEGIIRDRNELTELSIDVPRQQARVTLSKTATARLSDQQSFDRKTVPTAGGKGHSALATSSLEALVGNCDHNFSIQASKVLELMDRFSGKSQLFLDTGGVHSCALSDGNEILLFEDDIGRHNALDKVLGQAMMQDMPLQDKIILTSGRISTEILAKVARRGIPAIISRSAPTSAAIEQAKALGLTLIGFSRGSNFNVYTNFPCLERD
ncbi:MAG: formate dehydrogenase family accessory protein FdhD [Desulfuromonadales bacterium C00003094]|nr:MAG: formate dehydrogenase family accessory protein FdhD [Desulfuromonadales bacterium C00003094]